MKTQGIHIIFFSSEMNAESSRSHLILGIVIESTNLTSGAVVKGKVSNSSQCHSTDFGLSVCFRYIVTGFIVTNF